MTLEFSRRTLPFQTDFQIAGTRCFLSTNSPEVLQAAAQLRSPTDQNGTRAFEMEIIVDRALDQAPERLAYFRGLGHIVFAMVPPRSFVVYDLLRKRVHAVLSTAATLDHSFWNKLLLPITIGVLGTTVGVAPIHSACLERQGCGLLIAGVSGAGKSTLTAALAQLGFALISDDWTYISTAQRGLVAHGLSAPVKLLPDAARFFPELRGLAPRTAFNGELAYEIEPKASALGFAVKSASHPRWIFLLERTSTAGCHFVPCRPEYVRDFFERSGERLPDELTEAKAFRSRVIRNLACCPAWIVRTGENPQKTARAVDAFLEEAEHAAAV